MRDLVPIAVFASALLLAGAASADIPPPNTQQCASEEAGAGCTTDDGKAGTCVTSTCSKLDYSDGSPPGTIEYECKICQEGSSSSASSGSSSGSGSTGSGSGSGGGCLISAGDVGSGVALLGLALPLMFLMRRRRRSA